MKISAIVLTRNEERNIKRCLENLHWCDEIVVIDDNSTDNTVSIAKKIGAKVFIHGLNNNFSDQRNFGLGKAIGDWILFVDADEIITSSLCEEIKFNIKLPRLSPSHGEALTDVQGRNYEGFLIKRTDVMWGKKLKYGESGDIKLLRLAKKNAGKWVGKVHEVWEIKEGIGQLENPILHYPHQTMTNFLGEINFYTTLRAEELFAQHVKVNWWDLIIYPKVKFIQNYFLKLGALDGMEGLVIALMMSFHSFLVRGKLWQLHDENTGR